MKSLIFISLFNLTCLLHLNSVENSIIVDIEKFEEIKNLPESKYTKHQFEEINGALSRLDERIRIVSFNVLFPLYDHKLEDINRWPHRASRVVAIIRDMSPDIMGVQELYKNQLDDLMPHLKDEYEFYAKPCEDGELNGIFYRRDRFNLIDSKVLYMTSTPDTPSSETLTILFLRDLVTGKDIAVFNTHFAFSRLEKREFQARFVAKEIGAVAETTPVVLTGDLNTFPNFPDHEKFPFLDGDYIHRILTKKHLKDAREVSLLGHVGPLSTFTNLPEDVQPFQGTGTPGVMLDHIYVSEEIKVLIHAVQHGTVKGSFPSDHMPLIADILIGEKSDVGPL